MSDRIFTSRRARRQAEERLLSNFMTDLGDIQTIVDMPTIVRLVSEIRGMTSNLDDNDVLFLSGAASRRDRRIVINDIVRTYAPQYANAVRRRFRIRAQDAAAAAAAADAAAAAEDEEDPVLAVARFETEQRAREEAARQEELNRVRDLIPFHFRTMVEEIDPQEGRRMSESPPRAPYAIQYQIGQSPEEPQEGYDIGARLFAGAVRGGKLTRKWIQEAIGKPGRLHRTLGIPKEQKIPVSTLRTVARVPGKVGKRAKLALTLRSFRGKGYPCQCGEDSYSD